MADSTFTFRVDDGLKAAFAEAASAQERTAAQLMRVLMREVVDRHENERTHDAWFRAEVERAVGEADETTVERVPHEEVRTRWQQQRAELERRAAGDTA
jgi:predicted transcriptional regulator